MLAGFVGVPIAFEAVWPWTATIEHFLHPSFVAEGAHAAEEVAPHVAARRAGPDGLLRSDRARRHLVSPTGNYVERPEEAERMAESLRRPAPGADQQVLRRRAVRRDRGPGHDGERRRSSGPSTGRWWDGAVNGTGWTTIAAAWVSHVLDKYVVDGLVNLTAWMCGEASYVLSAGCRTGLIQNYAFRHVARRVRARDLVPRRAVIGHCHERNDSILLSLILFTPLAGALVLLFVPKRQEGRDPLDRQRGPSVLGFLVSLPLWFRYDSANPDFQFRGTAAVDSLDRRGVLPRGRRLQRAADPADHADGRDCRAVVLDGDHRCGSRSTTSFC